LTAAGALSCLGRQYLIILTKPDLFSSAAREEWSANQQDSIEYWHKQFATYFLPISLKQNGRILLQLRFGNWLKLNNRLIATIQIWVSLTWDTHHTQLVLQATKIFSALLRSNKLWTKQARLHTSILLWHPINRQHVQIDKETSARLMSYRVTCEVSINTGTHDKTKPWQHWHVKRQIFFYVQTELCHNPVFLFKLRFINHRITWVKDNFWIVILLETCNIDSRKHKCDVRTA